MDHHTVAAISITGTYLEVLGGLYLAYDLLGGQHGPLRLLTRAVTPVVIPAAGPKKRPNPKPYPTPKTIEYLSWVLLERGYRV